MPTTDISASTSDKENGAPGDAPTHTKKNLVLIGQEQARTLVSSMTTTLSAPPTAIITGAPTSATMPDVIPTPQLTFRNVKTGRSLFGPSTDSKTRPMTARQQSNLDRYLLHESSTSPKLNCRFLHAGAQFKGIQRSVPDDTKPRQQAMDRRNRTFASFLSQQTASLSARDDSSMQAQRTSVEAQLTRGMLRQLQATTDRRHEAGRDPYPTLRASGRTTADTMDLLRLRSNVNADSPRNREIRHRLNQRLLERHLDVLANPPATAARSTEPRTPTLTRESWRQQAIDIVDRLIVESTDEDDTNEATEMDDHPESDNISEGRITASSGAADVDSRPRRIVSPLHSVIRESARVGTLERGRRDTATRLLAVADYGGLEPSRHAVATAPSKQPVSSCEVVVDIKTIDEASSECTGQITICGLGCGGPAQMVKTFFVGQIIDNSRRYGFQTRGWGARLDHDEDFWATFSEFPTAWKRRIGYNNFKEDVHSCDGIFMRFKECFIKEDCSSNVSPSTSGFINGFYYICLNKDTGAIHGYYFNGEDELRCGRAIDRQELRLNYVDQSGEFSLPTPVYAFM